MEATWFAPAKEGKYFSISCTVIWDADAILVIDYLYKGDTNQ